MQALLDYLGFLRLDLKDVAEILVVSFLLYRVLVVYTGTRAFQVLIGFVLLVSVYVASQALQLRLIPYLLSQVFTYGAFALIVIFQPELRAALARLGRTRLFQAFARLEQQEQVDAIRGDQTEAGWGRQIRSYVLQPYQMVKDLRTGHEIGNISAVLDGDLDSLVDSYLQWRREQAD